MVKQYGAAAPLTAVDIYTLGVHCFGAGAANVKAGMNWTFRTIEELMQD
jgi:hypothetical protein